MGRSATGRGTDPLDEGTRDPASLPPSGARGITETLSSRYDQGQVRDVGLMRVLASTRPAGIGERLIAGGAIVLISGLLIVLGAALATNYRGFTEWSTRLGGAQSEGMVRFGMAVNRAGGVFFVVGGVAMLVGGLAAAVSGDVQLGCGYALICA
jgi:hypothetical protein